MRFPPPIKAFIDGETWKFAKTMPEWPHEYLVKEKVDPQLFEAAVRHIREHGFEGRFYSRVMTYFVEDRKRYWTMGEPIERTIILNRCREEDSYEQRLKSGTLPHQERAEDARQQ